MATAPGRRAMPSPRAAASIASGMLLTTSRPRTGNSMARPRERKVQRPRGASGVKRMQSCRRRSRGVRGVPRSRRYSRLAKQRSSPRHSSRATTEVSFSVPDRNARSNFPSTRSTCRSVRTSSNRICGYRGSEGPRTSFPASATCYLQHATHCCTPAAPCAGSIARATAPLAHRLTSKSTGKAIAD